MCSTIRSRRQGVHLWRQVVVAVLFAPLFVTTSLAADTIQVPRDHKTIQAAMDAAILKKNFGDDFITQTLGMTITLPPLQTRK